MFETSIDLSKASRKKLITLLNARLADATDLGLRLKHAHWNVKGPHFFSLHELFDKLAGEVAVWVDDLAERAVALGGVADGRVGAVARESSLPPYPDEAVNGSDHLAAVASSLAAFGKAVRAAIDTATKLEDADTADLFTEVSRGTDKALWFVEAHLQG